MAVTRADVVAHLSAALPEFLAAAGMDQADTAGDLKEPIDAALRLLGVARADRPTYEVADADGDAYEALARLTTMERVVAALGRKFDVSTEGDSYRLSQQRDAAEKLLTRLRIDPLVLPYAGGGWSSGAVSLGWVEPEEEVA
jgi:hypothetical protein